MARAQMPAENYLAKSMLLSFVLDQSDGQAFFLQRLVDFFCLIWWDNLQGKNRDRLLNRKYKSENGSEILKICRGLARALEYS